jgi:hypothetical protein
MLWSWSIHQVSRTSCSWWLPGQHKGGGHWWWAPGALRWPVMLHFGRLKG